MGARAALPEPCARGGRGPPGPEGTARRPRGLPQACLDTVPLRGPPPLPCSGPGSYRCGGGVCCVSIARVLKSEGPGPPACRPALRDPACAPRRVPIHLDCRAALLRRGFLGPQILQDVYTHLKSWWGTGSVHLNPAESFSKGLLQSAV